MLRDPALILWLDGQRNTRQAPNENLARELMELFTLGIGAYTEDDIKAGARALTGWTIDRGHCRRRWCRTGTTPPQDDPGPDRQLRRRLLRRPAGGPTGPRHSPGPSALVPVRRCDR